MTSLVKRVKQYTTQLPPEISKDQYFLIDEAVISKLISVAQVTVQDRILEVGPGLGFITEELAKKAKEVIAIEIDKRFKPFLEKLPSNVEVIFGDAYKALNNKQFLTSTKPPTKTISSMPYSQAQNMLHNYTGDEWYKGNLYWIAPLSLVNKINKEPILSAYFEAELIERVPKNAFYPQPNTSSAIIHIKKVENPLKTGSFDIYFRRWLYKHEEWKVKNALREGIINSARELKGVTVTKNQARGLIAQLGLSENELEKLTNNIRPNYYFQIPKDLLSWFNQLKS